MNLKVGDELLHLKSKMVAVVFRVCHDGGIAVYDKSDSRVRGILEESTINNNYRRLKVPERYFDKLKELI